MIHRMILFLLLSILSLRGFSMEELLLSSPVFASHSKIPSQYSCDGLNRSPPLVWQDADPRTKSYVLIVDDPDAPSGLWTHWVLFNIPKNVKQLTEGASTPTGALSAKNSWNDIGYRGPCPPSGTHRYFFTLYALDTPLLALDASATPNEVKKAMQDHVLASNELIGLYR